MVAKCILTGKANSNGGFLSSRQLCFFFLFSKSTEGHAVEKCKLFCSVICGYLCKK